jgi:hypothetical protein
MHSKTKIFFDDNTHYNLDNFPGPKLERARIITAEFYSSLPADSPQSYWAYYDRFFLDVALPLSAWEQIKPQLVHVKRIKILDGDHSDYLILKEITKGLKVEVETLTSPQLATTRLLTSSLRQGWKFILYLSSHFNLIKQRLERNPKIVFWTPDYMGPNGHLDPRLGELESMVKSSGIRVFPWVRFNGVSLSHSIKNFIHRRGAGVYYDVIAPRSRHEVATFGDMSVLLLTLHRQGMERFDSQAEYWHQVLRLSKPLAVIPWFYSSRTACLIEGSRRAKIPTFGFMHGVSVLSFMGHEYMPEYRGKNQLGPDYFGVWSQLWLKRFSDNARIYTKDAIELSGPLRPPGQTIARRDRNKIYLVSETHAHLADWIPYFEILETQKQYQIVLKIRPHGTDKFWNSLSKTDWPQRLGLVLSRESSPAAFADALVVIGSHSTVIWEAAAAGSPVLIVNTSKWGDYFDVKVEAWLSENVWVESPASLMERLKAIRSEEDYAFQGKRYLGEGKLTDWLMPKLLKLKEAHSD